MSGIFFTVLYQPIFNVFILFYHLIPDVGVTIVIMTVLIKAIVYPFTAASMRAQQSLAAVQSKVEALKEVHKDDKQALTQATLKLYSEHKINPLSSCLPLVIQVIITIALYYVLRAGLTSNDFSALYSFVKSPGHINTTSLGFFDLSRSGNILLALLAGAAQFWQAKLMIRKRPPKAAGAGAKDEDMAAIMNKQMLYLMPVVTVLVGMKLPAGLSLYWFISTLLSALQQLAMNRSAAAHPPATPTAPTSPNP